MSGSGSPTSPTSPNLGLAFGVRNGRMSTVGTTSTSPSMRKRSMQSTISMIKEVVEGEDEAGEGVRAELPGLADLEISMI